MSNTNKADLRNSKEPYIIELNDQGRITKEELRFHIDSQTRQFKIWHLSSLKAEIFAGNTVTFKNSNGAIHYRMQVTFLKNSIHVTCDCDRRVERLCHHSYTALKDLIATEGETIFSRFTAYLLQAA